MNCWMYSGIKHSRCPLVLRMKGGRRLEEARLLEEVQEEWEEQKSRFLQAMSREVPDFRFAGTLVGVEMGR